MEPILGKQIRKLRKEKKMTMKELAKNVDVTEQAISQYERGIRTPSQQIVKKIALALDVDIDSLYVWDVSDVFFIMHIAAEILDHQLKDREDITWNDIIGLSNNEFSEFINYLYYWSESIICSRLNNANSELDIRFILNSKNKK